MKAKILTLIVATASCLPSFAQEEWDLRKCIDYAIEHNLSIKQQEATRDQNAVELNTARWSRLPNLNGNVGQSFNFGRALQADNTYGNRNTQNTNFSLGTNVPLFTGLQIPNNIALCKLNLKAAIEDLNKAKEDISIQVTSSYLQVLFDEELAKIAHSQVELSREQLKLKTAFFENGKASEAEVYDARSRVAQDEMSAVQADNNYRLALLDLSQLLELPTPDGFRIASPKVDDNFNSLSLPEDIYADAVLTKPGIKAAQYRLQGASKNIRIAQSNLFNRFETRNRVKMARIQRTALSWKLEESKKLLFKEIQQAYYNAVAAESKFKSSRTATESAEASFRLMSEKYANGKATATEYNEMRTNWMKATSDMVQAKYDYLFRSKILDFYKGIPLTLE